MPLTQRDMQQLQACWQLCCERLARERTRQSVEDLHLTLKLMFETAIQALAISDSLQAFGRRRYSEAVGQPLRYLTIDVYEDGRGMIARADIPTDYGRPDRYEFGWRPRLDVSFNVGYMSSSRPYTVSQSDINYARATPTQPSLLSERDRMMRQVAEMQAVNPTLFDDVFPSLKSTPPPPPFVPAAAVAVQRENAERRRAHDAHVETCQLAMYLLRRLISDAIYIMWNYQLDDFTKRCFLAAEERELIPRPTPADSPPDELPIDVRPYVPFGSSTRHTLTEKASTRCRALVESYRPKEPLPELEMD